MIRPKHFGFNSETAASNSFQHKKSVQSVAQKAIQEFDKMIEQLSNNGVEVKVFDDDSEDILPDSVFPNNWFSHFPDNTLVIYSMMAENRQKEIRKDLIDELREEVSVKNFIDLSAERNKGRFLEGTGSIVFDHDSKIAYCCISPRSNLQLLKELCNAINYDPISFESVDLNGEQIYHTNVMMSVGSELVIACLESIPDLLERKILEKRIIKSGKKLMEISYGQMNDFAANTIELLNADGDSVLVMSDKAIQSLSDEQLHQLNSHFKLISIEIPTIEAIGGGSVRCMIAGCYCSKKNTIPYLI